MSRKKIDPTPQRQLALRLRYHIDCVLSGSSADQHIAEIRLLVRDNPTSILSRHVAHNLGAERMAWLKTEGYIS